MEEKLTIKNLALTIKSDLYKETGKKDAFSLIKYFLSTRNVKIAVLYRICHFLHYKNLKLLLVPFNLLFKMAKALYSIDLPYNTHIGKGLYLGHVIGIVISAEANIGNNVNLSQGVTIGYSPRGPLKGHPTIGNNVYIGPNAVIIGNIKIGNNVAIGANAVCTKDIPDNAVAVGVPAKVISYNGSQDYIIRNDYE